MMMMQTIFVRKRPVFMSACVAALLGLSFGAGAVEAKSKSEKRREDARTCQSFGAQYGTPAYTDCMLDQQRRRDTKKLDQLEESARLSQLARDGQIMADRARRQRCDRDPDRRECGRR